MQNEHHSDLVEIQRGAEYRRVQDFGAGLRLFFERRRQRKFSDLSHSAHDRGEAMFRHRPRAATSG